MSVCVCVCVCACVSVYSIKNNLMKKKRSLFQLEIFLCPKLFTIQLRLFLCRHFLTFVFSYTKNSKYTKQIIVLKKSVSIVV